MNHHIQVSKAITGLWSYGSLCRLDNSRPFILLQYCLLWLDIKSTCRASIKGGTARVREWTEKREMRELEQEDD